MRIYLILKMFLICLVATNVANAQQAMSGRIQSGPDEAVPFATIAVMELPDSTLVTGTTADMDGYFSLKPTAPGDYVLRFSAIGYSTAFSDSFSVSGPDFERDFGTVFLEQETALLDEVMVETWKPRLRAENGSLVMSVENSALTAGNTAYEVLSRAPGVAVAQGEFLINGKKGVTVMIDGRMTYLSGQELQTLLEAMPAENLKEIEVIHSPGAKYDAEGVSGILNLKLKKNTLGGFSGSVYGGFQQNDLQLFNGGANLSYMSGRWNSFANLDLSQRGYVRDQKQYRTFAAEGSTPYLDQVGKETRKQLVPSVQLGTEYRLAEGHRLGMMANLIYEDRENDWNTITTLGNLEDGPNVNIDARNHMESNIKNTRYNLYYAGDLDTLGSKISADLDYVRLENNSDGLFVNEYTYVVDGSEELRPLSNESLSDYDIYAAKVDLKLALSESAALEMGAKVSKVISDSELSFYEEENGNSVFDPSRSDRFRYEENIYAGYMSYSQDFNDTWNLQAGLRAEQTYGEGKSFSGSGSQERSYLEFFPNLMLEQNVSENYKLNYSFGRRISRPNYAVLNPFIFYLDPYTYIVGNPDLEPQFTNTIRVSQTIFKKYNLLLSYNFHRDYIGEVPAMDPETRETTFTQRNMDNYKSYGATLVAPLEISSFWKTNNTIVLNQEEYDLQIGGEPLERRRLYFLGQSNHQVNLPLGWKLELNGTYRGPMYYGVYQISGQWWLDMGLKKSFLEDKLTFTLRGMDVFRSRESSLEADFLGNHYEMEQYRGTQAFSINLRYSFNAANQREVHQNSLEELERAGGA